MILPARESTSFTNTKIVASSFVRPLINSFSLSKLKQIGVDPATLRDTSTSVYLGSCYNDAANAKFEEITSTTQNLDIGPSEISKRFKFRGATILVDTACASSFSALHEAVQAIKMNICDQVIVGGIALHLKPGLATGFR